MVEMRGSVVGTRMTGVGASRHCCTLQRRSPDSSDTGRLASPAGTAQDAPKPTPMITLADGEVGWAAVLH